MSEGREGGGRRVKMQDEVEMRTEELARWTVERSKSLGADCASAEVSHDKGLSVTVRMGEVDAVEHTEERVLTLNAWIGGRKGCASTADFSERSLEAAVQAAVDIARVSAEDPAAGLPEAEDLQATCVTCRSGIRSREASRRP